MTKAKKGHTGEITQKAFYSCEEHILLCDYHAKYVVDF